MWSAEPGIDLADQRSILTRAAYESMIIAHYGGLDTAYPGFAGALVPSYARKVPTALETSLVGTFRAHILQVLDTAAGFKATVCTQWSKVGIRVRDGDYRINQFSGQEEFVEFTRDTEEHRREEQLHRHDPEPPTPSDQYLTSLPTTEHQWSAPTEDLFTDTGLRIDFGGDSGETMYRCEAWGRSIEPSLPPYRSSETIISPTPPETLPAYPGW
ncbi:hypothetical protein BO226_20445 [Rhodococcus sp. 2G]|uniref:hypothetical protein n=1 Tax=unclassified Rhodococcus (in: high G+C Gram-positive bacteria) TaxID=192944 RepID=UPI0007DA0BBC|nr:MULTISPECIES: hypothetical protein [unclassified Rhodococcus (in: high G+C Gram-positive bacteria)]APE11274.1 hypothetical protein BO226_20445 [Rhodococcus sp. 2G]